MNGATFTWARVPAPIRTVARWATIVNAVGYLVALAFVGHTTGITPSGTSARYRGVDPGLAPDTAMQFPKPLAEMLTSTHTHLLAMSALFVVSGLCFALCAWPAGRLKRFLIAEPFAATLVSMGSLWLVRYVDGRFAWLVLVSSVSMAVVFAIQTVVTLRELSVADRNG